MDLLAIVYSLFLSMILGSPFLYFLLHREEKQSGRNLIDLKNERRILMENLRDLKTDFETGKFSRDEFEVSSSEIIQQLERIDSELKELEIFR